MGTGIVKRLLAFDRKRSDGTLLCVAGIDEAGRGPLAGPVVAAAVILTPHTELPAILSGLNDSKRVVPKARGILYRMILRCGTVGIGVATEEEIDRINIYQATRLAMKRSVLSLPRTPDLLLIDGRMMIDLPVTQQPVVGGDGRSAAIAAASIIAKVYRDNWMCLLDELYPKYGFCRNKGYGTSRHLKTLRQIGPSPVHRKSFSPVEDWEREVAVENSIA